MLSTQAWPKATYESPIAAPFVNPNSLNAADASGVSASSRELIAKDVVMRKERIKDKKRSRCEAIFATEVEQSEEEAMKSG
jgi:hypothetical protein